MVRYHKKPKFVTIVVTPATEVDQRSFLLVPSPLRLIRHKDGSENADVVSVIRGENDRESKNLPKDPADQWRSIVASSKASIESLARSAKERRLMRGSGLVSARPSRETLGSRNPSPTVPARKPLLSQQSEPRLKSTIGSPEKSNQIEGTPRLDSSNLALSPIRAGDVSLGEAVSQGKGRRSPSKPLPGAVRAMTALFNNAVKKTSGGPVEVLGGPTRNNQNEDNSLLGRDMVDESPIRAGISRPAPVSTNPMTTAGKQAYQGESSKDAMNIRTSPMRPQMKESPAKPFNYTLQPVQEFTETRREPQVSPEKATYDMNRSQPPKLGTMAPYPEEPPVGHFLRPSSTTSRLSQNTSIDEMYFDQPNPRHVSGNSILHAQIRSLQRQLEIRREELLQVRRRLETQEHIDIGTLCEQLRIAKREGKMWRKRAEAAEKRLAIFQQFGVKFQALNDGVNECLENGDGMDSEAEMDSLSSCSGDTEDCDEFTDLMEHAVMGTEVPDGGYGGALYEIDTGAGSNAGAMREYQPPPGRPRRMVKVWADGEEMLGLQQDDNTIVWD
ncbi:hypothetical protein F4861DRAFT_233855 [Xylaria intraflava]|nr:hypothetical protein F4861DRAFT_233855 [Xylaria intraflava]